MTEHGDALVGDEVTWSDLATSAKAVAEARLAARIRGAMGLGGPPVAACMDPAVSAMPIGGAARTLHADLGPMVIGGVASLFLQSLHPLAVAGVVEHSNFRRDPLGRLQRTANYVGTTTYGTMAEAEAAAAMVRRVHERVRGTAPNGQPYAASDPELLTFVHVAEVAMFAEASRRFGALDVEDAFYDAYVAEMAASAIRLGATDVPRTQLEVDAYLGHVRRDLGTDRNTREVERFLLRGAAHGLVQRSAYGLVVAAALSCLPPFARRLLNLPLPPLVRPLVVRPAASAFAAALRLAVPAPPH